MSRLDLYSIDDANDLSHAHMPGGWQPDGRSPLEIVRGWSLGQRAGYVVGVFVLAIVVVLLTVGLLAMGGPG